MIKRIIGITGGIGCGKTTVTNQFSKLGVAVVDADIAAREVVSINSTGLNAITEKLGDHILLDTGELNRAKLREIIFNDANQKHWLENLLHPLIRKRITQQLNADTSNHGYTLLSSPLLLETDQHKMTDFIIAIDLDTQLQVNRAMQRDSNTREQIEKIINSQLSREQRNAKADMIINNDGSIDDLQRTVAQTHQKLSQIFPN
jgi:dephospho-CoA kinase